MYAHTGSKGKSIENLVETGPILVPGSATVMEALRDMINNGSPVLAVVEGEDIIGMVTASDMGNMVVRNVDLDKHRIRDFAALAPSRRESTCVRVRHDEEPLSAQGHAKLERYSVLVTKDEKIVGTISVLDALKVGWKRFSPSEWKEYLGASDDSSRTGSKNMPTANGGYQTDGHRCCHRNR